MFGAVEGHVLDKMGEPLLIVIFEDGACVYRQPKFRPLLGLLVGAHIIANSIRQLADGDLAFGRDSVRKRRWYLCGSRSKGHCGDEQD